MARKPSEPKPAVRRPEIIPIEPEVDELPDETTLLQMDIPIGEWPDFMKAWRFMLFTAQGLNISAAAKLAGIARRSVYEERWTLLFQKVQRNMLNKYMAQTTAGTNRVFELWSEMLDRVTFDVLDPNTEPGDRVKAIEFLYTAVISQRGAEKKDDSQERDYLKSNPSFNPQMPLTLVEGDLTINILNGTSQHAQVDTGDDELYVDAPRRPDAWIEIAANEPEPKP